MLYRQLRHPVDPEVRAVKARELRAALQDVLAARSGERD